MNSPYRHSRDLGLTAVVLRTSILAAILVCVTGCPPQPTEKLVFEPVSIHQAIDRVDSNAARIEGTLQARGGNARGYFTDSEGKKHRFDLDAKLLVNPPKHMRLDLSALGQSQMVLGSDEELYWLSAQTDLRTLWWGHHGYEDSSSVGELGIRPDLILEALGLASIPQAFPTIRTIVEIRTQPERDGEVVAVDGGTNGLSNSNGLIAEQETDSDTNGLPVDEPPMVATGEYGPYQRITNTHQQLLYITYNQSGESYVSKEYWLSGFEPRLIDRILFRDLMGRIIMEARLMDYGAVADNGSLVAHRIEVKWPASKSEMIFTTADWRSLPRVDENHPGFAFPLNRGESFERVINLDSHFRSGAIPAVNVIPWTEDDRGGQP